MPNRNIQPYNGQIEPRRVGRIQRQKRDEIEGYIEGEVLAERRDPYYQPPKSRREKAALFVIASVIGIAFIICGLLVWRVAYLANDVNVAQPGYTTNQVNQYNINPQTVPDVTIINQPESDGSEAPFLCGGTIVFFILLVLVIGRH